jgi:hypothetical protein
MGNNHDGELTTMLPGGWMSVVPTLFHGQHDLLSMSLLAMYTGFVGRKKEDFQLKSLAMNLYAKSIQTLRQASIWTCSRQQSDIDARIATILVFSRCELLSVEENSGGYMAHLRGGLHLLQRFGNKLPDTELSRVVVKKLRNLGVSVHAII